MISKKIQTILSFKTIDNSFIDAAITEFFPKAEWLEVRNRSMFESQTLLDAILDTYFVNSAEMKQHLLCHSFDVVRETSVYLSIESTVMPTIRYEHLAEPLPNARFAFAYFNIESSLEEITITNKPKIIPISYD